MEEPKIYGLFHIVSLCLICAFTAFISVRYKNCPDKTFRTILFVCWTVIIFFEVYKQIAFAGYHDKDGVPVWGYQWYAFPFQFCSTPHYVLPLIIFLKDGKVRKACMAFMATFSLFAGLSVCVYPATVFVEMIGVNIQTMVHHGSQVALGVFIAVRMRGELNGKWYLSALPVFFALTAIALLLNGVVPPIIGSGHTFNMFFISWRFPSSLPILSYLYADPAAPLIPYPAFLFLYVSGFSLCAFLTYALTLLFKKTKYSLG